MKISAFIQQAATDLQNANTEPLAAYLYDLPALRQHVQQIHQDLPDNVELFYAVKANPDERILAQVAKIVDGLEVASAGELELIQPYLHGKPCIFGGPAKLDSDLEQAMQYKVSCLHIESITELRRVIRIAEHHQSSQPILLRLNPILPNNMQSTLTMAGRPTAFGIDEAQIIDAIEIANSSPWVDLQGFHIHALSHQLDANRHLFMLDYLLKHASKLATRHNVNLRIINLGGGIGINYRDPDKQYQWSVFAKGIQELANATAYRQLTIRFEMGRYLTAFCGYYLMEVLDLKQNHGEYFAICRGGTHQFRLPAAQGHDHPFVCLSRPNANIAHLKHLEQHLKDTHVTIAGQLCTPKDIIARQTKVNRIAVGDLLILPMAGAYAWNISHQQFLCHPAPIFHYLEECV
ncbi:type III PLP-dependent enzyme [Marinomonas agarivorans]|nr:type III PLP-dependent enzyme [Marinomonas agarivorans]